MDRKSAITETNELENLNDSNLQHFLEIADTNDADASIKQNTSSIESSINQLWVSSTVNSFIGTPIEKIDQVVSENHQLQKREKSIVIAISRNFRVFRPLLSDKNND